MQHGIEGDREGRDETQRELLHEGEAAQRATVDRPDEIKQSKHVEGHRMVPPVSALAGDCDDDEGGVPLPAQQEDSGSIPLCWHDSH